MSASLFLPLCCAQLLAAVRNGLAGRALRPWCPAYIAYSLHNPLTAHTQNTHTKHTQFKTVTQGERYDPDAQLAATWLPELAALPPGASSTRIIVLLVAAALHLVSSFSCCSWLPELRLLLRAARCNLHIMAFSLVLPRG